MNKNQDKGFTLVELLIVIVILGILATVTVFAVGGVTSQANTNACQTEARTIATAAQAYFADEQTSTIAGADNAARFATLVAADLVTEASTTVLLAADGTVTAVGGGDCDGEL